MLIIVTENLIHQLVKVHVVILEIKTVHEKTRHPNHAFIFMYFVRMHAYIGNIRKTLTWSHKPGKPGNQVCQPP